MNKAGQFVTYDRAPNFPATDQHPDAKRAKVGKYMVDYLGDEPTMQQVLDQAEPTPAQIKVMVEQSAMLRLHGSNDDPRVPPDINLLLIRMVVKKHNGLLDALVANGVLDENKAGPLRM